MGEHRIREDAGRSDMRGFARRLLEEVRALERMLREGWFESGVRRVGAEQELFLVDRELRPANVALPVLERVGHGQITKELGLYNLELNLSPVELRGDALTRLERELRDLLRRVAAAAAEVEASVLMCGILPTLDATHLTLECMAPVPRFRLLNELMVRHAGGCFRTLIKGLDQLQVINDNVMLEAANTSMQLHFQVGADEFAHLYNLAQLISAPVLAAGVNSPVMMQRRLWQETRVALLQQCLDMRSDAMTQRDGPLRVTFGDRWVERSVLELFHDDIARFQALIAVETGEPPEALLDRGETPPLSALCLHNGTVYRWNRPRYGVLDGRPHLRIEHRVLPAGPTITDEIANAAFFFGLMSALDEEYGDVSRRIDFEDAKMNFFTAARYGLQAQVRWIDGGTHAVSELILGHLLPLARQGLARREVDPADTERFLGVVEARVDSGRTGAQWALDSLAHMGRECKLAECHSALVAGMLDGQMRDAPVHTWELAQCPRSPEAGGPRRVAQLMSTDLFTAHPDDLIDLAAAVMDWKHIRHVPVEDERGRYVGLLSLRRVLRHLAGPGTDETGQPAVSEVMRRDSVTVTPDTSVLEAVQLMRRHAVSCLPVLEGGRLVGILSERDLMDASASLLERWLRD